ncbi:unnamed protein product [Caenorhabditis auriculariae]|uniref:Uncharacterized protein n=1 Tax=Caenorhabditis auriculariae TaxID=2777116 RepID=A0A8S1HTU3_9PELO|nr:unnamed protein product [Caenorhabditis auriculariae]
MSVKRDRANTAERRKRLHELVDLREELKELQANLEQYEILFDDSVRKRSALENRYHGTDNEDQFLESLRIVEEKIHHHRQKISELQSEIIDKKECILSIETLVRMDEEAQSHP